MKCYECVTGGCASPRHPAYHPACQASAGNAPEAVTAHAGTPLCADCAIRLDRRARARGSHG